MVDNASTSILGCFSNSCTIFKWPESHAKCRDDHWSSPFAFRSATMSFISSLLKCFFNLSTSPTSAAHRYSWLLFFFSLHQPLQAVPFADFLGSGSWAPPNPATAGDYCWVPNRVVATSVSLSTCLSFLMSYILPVSLSIIIKGISSSSIYPISTIT